MSTATSDVLRSAEELLADPGGPLLLDVRWYPDGRSARAAYDAGHLPGAIYVDVDTELAAPPGAGGRHPLPDPAVFVAAMRRVGVTDDRSVVVYDDGPGTVAARLWWLLRHYGHERVRLLDGGLAEFVRAGGRVSTTPGQARPSTWSGEPGHLPVVDATGAADLARDGLLLDVRTPERFRGESEPIDPVAGHVPGAVNAPAAGSVDEHGRLLDAAALRSRFEALGDLGGPVAAYCGSGITAAQTVLALAHAGVDAALYAGSWSDWITDPSRPVATGD